MQTTSQQIFLVCSNEDQARLLRRQVEPLTVEFYPLQFISARPQSVVTSVDRQTSALIMTSSIWGADELMLVEQLRRGGYRGPVIVVAGQRVAEIKSEISLEPLIFLDKPVSAREIQGILRKYLSARQVQQQVFRRYPTEQQVEIELRLEDGKTARRVSRLTNLSKGGAFVECFSQVPLRVGEEFQLKLELKDLKRTYTMAAKVVWTQSNKERSAVGFGVAFTGPAEIHLEL